MMTIKPLKNAGPAEGQILRKPDGLLDEYYQLRGWDKNSIPIPEGLKESDLEEIMKGIGGLNG